MLQPPPIPCLMHYPFDGKHVVVGNISFNIATRKDIHEFLLEDGSKICVNSSAALVMFEKKRLQLLLEL